MKVITTTKEFQAKGRSEVMEACRKQCYTILTQICKLTYLKSTKTQQHWIDVLVQCFTKYATDRFKSKGTRFNYSWFFDKAVDELDVEGCYESLDKKYNNIKPSNLDFSRAADNYNELELKLQERYLKEKRILNTTEINEIIKSLDLYK